MRNFKFTFEFIAHFPLLFLLNTFLIVLSSLIEATSIFMVAPVIDLLINASIENASPITQKIVFYLSRVGITATLENLLIGFILANILKSGVQVAVNYLVLKTKYSVAGDIMKSTFAAFFQARWRFFSGSQQGMLLNTFMREMVVVGDAFGAIIRSFAAILQTVFNRSQRGLSKTHWLDAACVGESTPKMPFDDYVFNQEDFDLLRKKGSN